MFIDPDFSDSPRPFGAGGAGCPADDGYARIRHAGRTAPYLTPL